MNSCLLRWIQAAALAAAVLLPGVHAAPAPARAGVLDLRTWNFARDGIASLDGEWEFFWQQLLDPAAAAPAGGVPLAVPGQWNALAGAGRGFGSYRLRIDCKDATGLALTLPMQHAAMALYVNGRLVASQGEASPDPARYRAATTYQTVSLGGQSCPMNLLAHVANFDAFRGGLVRSMQLGTHQELVQRREQALVRSLVAMGGMFVLGLMSLAFYFWRRTDRTPLYFGLFCLSLGLSLGLSGERALQVYLGGLGFDAFWKLQFINWFASMSLFPLLLRSLYPRQVGSAGLKAILGFSGAGVLVVALTPVSVFSYLGPALQAGGAAMALYLAVVLARTWREGRRSAGVLLAGLAVLVAAVVHDVVFFRHLFGASMLPYGLLAFVLAPAALLAQRFARALSSEELRALEQGGRADLLVRATNAGVLDWDAVTGTVTHSGRYLEMLGYAAEPPPFRELVHPEDSAKVQAIFTRQLRDRSTSGLRVNEPMDYRMVRAGGDTIWVHAEAISLCAADGRTLRYICSFIDITAIKQTEQALETERERLRLLVRSTRAGFGDWDAVRDVVTYTDRFKEMLGFPAGADTSTWPSLFEMIHPDDREQARSAFREMIRRKHQPGEQEPGQAMSYRVRRTDGSYIWIHAEGIAQVDGDGRTRRFITSYMDVTAFREQEAALRAQIELTRTEQRRLELVVRGALVGIVDWDGRTHETYYSPRFREIRGYAPDADTTGWPDYFKVMIHPDDRERVIRRWVPFIKGKGPEGPFGDFYSPEEYRLLCQHGSYVWVRVSGMAVRDEQGFVLRWIAAVIDISERRAQQALLEQQNEALKENVRLREEVERIGRHDIKTPLNSIVAVPRLLREERRLGPEADELLGIVERAGYRILSMVNLSLDLYKMEQGSYIFRPDAVDLADLVGKVAADVRMHAASKQVRLQLDVAAAPYAWAEELLCYSLLANLMKNAVEASTEGAVVTVAAAAGRQGSVELRIHNPGAVPESVRASFFQKYATLGKASGTGLGTYSARLMALVQDGDVVMETSQEQGTTLTVRLRAAPEGKVPATVRHAAERRGSEPALVTSLPPMRVLLVDDDEYNLLIVRRFLPTPPFTVDTAINGKVAVAAAELQWPDIVFMDLDMPVMGGLEAVRELRALQLARLRSRCTIVALSSHDDDDTRQRALAAGFDRYLTKPVTRDIIHDTLLELDVAIGRAQPPEPVAAGLPAGMHDPVVADPDVEPVLAEFIASRRQLLAAMAQAMAAGSRGEVRRLAHQLAGSFALYGFAWAGEQSRWIERNFSEVDAARLEELCAQLADHLETVEVRFDGPG